MIRRDPNTGALLNNNTRDLHQHIEKRNNVRKLQMLEESLNNISRDINKILEKLDGKT